MQNDSLKLIIFEKIKKGVKIIDGFPGLGLVGSIATDFLIEHMNAVPVGMIMGAAVPPLAAVHGGKIIRPMGLYYAEKKNILILHVLSPVPGIEWEVSNLVKAKANELKGEVISLESVGVQGNLPAGYKQPKGFFFTNVPKRKKELEMLGLQPLKEGIVMGVTGALMLSMDCCLTCIFAETHSNMPDSRAAATIIQIIDDLLNLNVDPKPLLKSAEKFEEKVRTLMEEGQKAQQMAQEKSPRYVG